MRNLHYSLSAVQGYGTKADSAVDKGCVWGQGVGKCCEVGQKSAKAGDVGAQAEAAAMAGYAGT